MVKLFVGNLAETVDSHRLRNLFLTHVNVQECDVLKNFAFVHVATDDDADVAIEKLDKAILEGREIHIERSTSRLRKEPGMGDKCFTCGANDHKTPQCPQEQGRRKKRPNEGDDFLVKRPNNGIVNIATPVTQTNQTQCWGYSVGNLSSDAELGCPANPELRPLYEHYIESRTRYHYFREKLSKELSLQPGGAQASAATPAAPVNIGRFDLTRANQPPVAQAPAAPTKYPGANPASVPYNVGYQSTASYPGAQPTAAPYPGVQASHSGAQPSYGFSSPTPVQGQYATTSNYSSLSNSYSTPPSYKGSYSTPNYAK